MKSCKISCRSVLAIAVGMLLMAFAAIPAYAQIEIGLLSLDPGRGKIGDIIEMDGGGFDADEALRIYFSSEKADYRDRIDGEVTAYEILAVVRTNDEGEFDVRLDLTVPDKLTHGEDEEDVHGGKYYVYATYYYSRDISAIAVFNVDKGAIKLSLESASVGTEIEITGEDFRSNQEITIEYDEDGVDIISGDSETDDNGRFTGVIVIPESTTGEHIITAADESGDKPQSRFFVKPKITVEPTSQITGGTVRVSGTGFGDRTHIITLTFSGDNTFPIPVSARNNRVGSFIFSFTIPFYSGFAGGDAGILEVLDGALNRAEAELTILKPPAEISLTPATSLAAPGQVGTQLTVRGTSFKPSAAVTVTYSNSDGDSVMVATTTSDASGRFSSKFLVPPSAAGPHAVSVTDGIDVVTAVFVMESGIPPMPVPRLPEVAAAAEAVVYFDWEGVTDPSGVTYIFQIASDSAFGTIILERKGLAESEYVLAKGEKLQATGKETPYYWRVKAVDGAFNESEWTIPRSFYPGFSWTSIPAWAIFIWIGLGVVLLIVIGLWVRKRLAA